jgi:hypothetical protein
LLTSELLLSQSFVSFPLFPTFCHNVSSFQFLYLSVEPHYCLAINLLLMTQNWVFNLRQLRKTNSSVS